MQEGYEHCYYFSKVNAYCFVIKNYADFHLGFGKSNLLKKETHLCLNSFFSQLPMDRA